MVETFFHMMPFQMLVPFGMGFMMLFSVALFLAWLWAFYDILVVEEMPDMHRLLWILVVLVFNLVGVIIYVVAVKSLDVDVFGGFTERRRVSELERLADLEERGALTEDEFEREKERLLGD